MTSRCPAPPARPRPPRRGKISARRASRPSRRSPRSSASPRGRRRRRRRRRAGPRAAWRSAPSTSTPGASTACASTATCCARCRRRRAAGAEAGSLPAEAAERPDRVVYDGWSDNNDSRVRITSTTSWPYRAIGTLFDGGGDCTGTRIGPRHVLTAAHCIYNRDTASWNTITFKPGRDGAASAPYGSSGPHWYWVPDEYIAGAAGLNGYDIGLIILDTPVGNGWMGYGAWSGGFLSDQSIWMRGYPRCNTTGAPAGCEPKTLWGDTKTCGLGTFFNTDGDGWNREILTNCDGSAGQSGSSFYYYTADGVPASAGVFSQHYCLAGCPGTANDDYPNVITRITPTYLDVINWFRAEYP